MEIGIDFGTTRTVVAVRDRGNYPVVGFERPDGSVVDHWPTIVASSGKRLVFGWEAVAKIQDKGWVGVRSVKRALASASPDTTIRIGKVERSLSELLVGFAQALRRDLLERSNNPVPAVDGEPLRARIAVPAGANSAQRLFMLDAFRAGGFEVAGILNEPSAAGVEYADRYRKTVTTNREDVLVYDLGGGTFDVSLVRMSGGKHEVLAHAGDNHLGGDDFDELLLELALASAGREAIVDEGERTRMLEHCRMQKESLTANARKVTVEFEDGTSAAVPTAEYYEACTPLIERSFDAVGRVLEPGTNERFASEALAGVYVVGGASDLPVVARKLKEVFGRRVKRSPYPSAATAVGLAIAGSEEAPAIQERFARAFGVFRELSDGTGVAFDPILMPGAPVDERVRRYRAVHNVGCFRFAECDAIRDGIPHGDLLPWDVIRFPFEPALQEQGGFDTAPVRRTDDLGPWIEERYNFDAAGVVDVRITDLQTGYTRAHRLTQGPSPAAS